MNLLELPINATCPVANALDVLGQKWTILILREAFRGSTRFADFRRIGIPSEVLAGRLADLVEHRILERRPYQDEGARTRDEYVLTEAGHDAALVIAALGRWGLKHCEGTRSGFEYVDRQTGEPAVAGFVVGDRRIATKDVQVRVGASKQ